jgi:DNA-binding SARP family transcriptional activator/Tfp pilus assembly protein PilF
MQFEMHEPQLPAPPPVVRVFTLGAFRVLVGNRVVEDQAWRRRTARQLFKVLLTRPGRRMTRDEVVELFWPESDTDAAATNLRSTVYAMRRALEPSGPAPAGEVVFGDHDSVWLGAAPTLWTDCADFEQLVAEAWRSPDPLPLLEQASRLYAGDYLPDDLYEDWALERRDALKRMWTELQFGLAQALEARADVNAALQALERLLQADPCDERGAREQMKLLTRDGRRPEAVRVYQRLVQSLREDLDVGPSAETLELLRQITAGEVVGAPAVPASAFRCAYPFPVPTELVDRKAELATLEEVVAAGRTAGRVAVIAAPAGTGKSAVVGRIVQDAQKKGVLCLAGGCYEQREAVPLGPFRDALVDYLLAQAPEALEMKLGASVDDLAMVVPELGYYLKRPAERLSGMPTLDRTRAFGAIHACLRGLAERGPVLVCLEDLHAADEATLQLLHYLSRQMRRFPLMLLGTYRSDEAVTNQSLTQTLAAMRREGLVKSIALDAFDRHDTDRLVQSLLDGSLSDALGESLFATTGGNPLFVEQLILELNEVGLLERRSGIWHNAGALQSTPRIVRAVIAQRLHRLDAGCREMLSMASVLGQSLEHRVLLATSESPDEARLLHALDQAISAQILQETATGWAFRHSLMRDAVYRELTSARRMLLHRRAGAAMERLLGEHADDRAAELAYHFSLAGQDREIRLKALNYSMQAGRQAAALSSYPQAVAEFSRACDYLDADPHLGESAIRVQALEGKGWAQSGLARWPETAASFQQVFELAADPVRKARARGLVAFSFWHMGDMSRVMDECTHGLTELSGLETRDATEVRLQLQQHMALVWYLQGRYRSIVEMGRGMESAATRLQAPRPSLLARAVVAFGLMGQGLVDAALDQYQLVLDAAAAVGDKVQLATTHENLGYQNYLGGRFTAAREHLSAALSLYHDSASDLRAVNARQHLCRVLVGEGDLDRAASEVAQALEIEIAGHERWEADAHHILGTIKSLRADWDGALASFENAISIRRRVGDAANLIESLAAQGLIHQYLARWDRALASFAEAVSIAKTLDPSPPVVHALRNLGSFHLIRSEHTRAQASIEGAMRLAQAISQTLEFSPTMLSMAKLSALRDNLEGALHFARQALDSASTTEQLAEAHTELSHLRLAVGDAESAAVSAAAAVAAAERLRSPRLLGLAYLAAARSRCSTDARAAGAVFEQALQHADAANTPFERGIVRHYYAEHLQLLGTELERARDLAREAQAIFEEGGFSGRSTTHG